MAYAAALKGKSFILVAAIDFGTTFSGYAFSFVGNDINPELPEKIRTNKSWGANYGFQTYKAPTSVLTTRQGKFLAFGFEAEQRYGEAFQEDEEQPDMLLFRHFKMVLHNRENVSKTSRISSLDGTIKPALDIFAHAIRYLKNHLIDSIKLESGSEPDNKMIRWVITVPAIWSEESKQFMREAVFQAGCIETKESRNLIIALEPEAASLCCRRLSVANYANSEGIQFLPGMQYMVLDCGGGTCDITVHEIKSENEIKEVIRASGGPWGGTEIDRNFVRLLEDVFSKNFINAFRQKHPHEWSTFLITFEQMKKNFKQEPDSKISVTLPYIMARLYEDMNKGERIEKKVRQSESSGIKFANGILLISHERSMNLFVPIIESISMHMSGLFDDHKVKQIRYLFMVGGFSESQVLQSVIKEKFQTNAVTVLIPSESQLAIIKGAVLFGHKPAEISTRIAKLTYGTDVNEDFNPNMHAPNRRYFDAQINRYSCSNLFDCFVQQNEEVTIGQKKVFEYFPYETFQNVMDIEILAKDGPPDTPVQYADVPGIMKLGNVSVDMAGRGRERSVRVEVLYGGTELQIDATDELSGNKSSTTIDFLSKDH